MRRIFLLIIFTFLYTSVTLGQGEIQVNMFEGKPLVEIPLWTLSGHGISCPITLTYDANSAKPDQQSFYGQGWDLLPSYSVSREVRGLPDDFGYNETRKGWLYESSTTDAFVAEDIGSFLNSADLSATTCSDEVADNTKLISLNYLSDSEPDIFSYQLPGYAGSFLFDNNLNIRMIPYQDVKIEFTPISATNKRITSFKITTNDGFVYTFDYISNVTKSAVKFEYLNTVSFLSTEYEWYKAGVNYTHEWKLTRMEAPSGAYINYLYEYQNDQNSDQPINAGIYVVKDPVVVGSKDINVRKIYTLKETSPRSVLSKIQTSFGAEVDFEYNGNFKTLSSIIISDQRRGAGNTKVKNFGFTFNEVPYRDKNGTPVYSRVFLDAISEYSGCDIIPPYRFTYTGVNEENYLYVPGNSLDFWGFPNGANNEHPVPKVYIYPTEPPSERYRLYPIPNYTGTEIILDGADRRPSGNTTGTLSTILYQGGAMTTLNYEPHTYYDARTGQSYMAGGLRIGSIKYQDGITPNSYIYKTFTYKDAAGNSSGRLVSKPVFALPSFKWKDPNYPNSTSPANEKTYESLSITDAWKFLTIRSESDLSSGEAANGSTVGYLSVTAKREGAGSVKFEYLMPGVYGETSNGDWVATTNKFARPASCSAMGIAQQTGTWAFPFSRNPSYDYERGLLWKKSEFNDLGKLMRLTETTYQYLYKTGTLPAKVWGLKYDEFPFSPNSKIFLYGKYFLLTDVNKVPLKETSTLYDEADATNTKSQVEFTDFLYESTNHKLLTQIRKTASDGNQYATKMKYPQDYTGIGSNPEDAVRMINRLISSFRHGMPIEQISTIKKGTASERITGASFIKFAPFSYDKPLLESKWTLNTEDPLLLSSFSPSAITQQSGISKLTYDSKYEKSISYLGYNPYDIPKGAVGKDRVPQVTGFGYNSSLPVFQITDAEPGQFAFSDFETTTGSEFQVNQPSLLAGRTGVNAIYPLAKLSYSIRKANTGNYILSFWIKSNAAVNFTVTLKNAIGSVTYYTTTFQAQSSGGSDFVYVRKIIPISTVSSVDFLVEIQAPSLPAPPPGNPAPSLLPLIDDVSFYPDFSSLDTYTYDIPFGTSSVTNSNGVTSYTVYDQLGRVKYLLDQDKNIIARKTYKFSKDVDNFLANFDIPDPLYAYEPMTFSATGNVCFPGVTYEWNFGSGFTIGSRDQSYTFGSAGEKTVVLRVTHPEYGVKTISKNVNVGYKPIPIEICAKGVQELRIPEIIVISNFTCSSITDNPPAYGIIFKVRFVDSDDLLSFQWQIKDISSDTWTAISGATGTQYIYPKVLESTPSFSIRCMVSSSSGRKGVSSHLTVTISQ